MTNGLLELQKIISLKEENLDAYVTNRVTLLDNTTGVQTYMDIGQPSLIDGWVNSRSMFLPSGLRRKGFNLDSKKLYIEYAKFLREYFGDADISKIEEFVILLATNSFIIEKFDGLNLDAEKRNSIFTQVSLLDQYQNKIPAVNLEDLFDKGIIRCVEKSAIANNLMNFIGVHSSIIICEAKHNEKEAVGHAFNMIFLDNQHTLFDASFYAQTTDGGAYPLVVGVSETTLQKEVLNCDIGEFANTLGDDELLLNQGIIVYTFPATKYCELHQIGLKKL